jgi:hypothetical protein
MMQDVHGKLNPGWPWQKQKKEEDSCHQQIGLKFKEETSKMLHLEHTVLKLQIVDQEYLEVLKCGAGEG